MKHLGAALLILCASIAPAADWPERSIYQLTDAWTDQNSRAVSLAEFSGQWVIIAMFFSNCDYVCPRIVTDMRQIERQCEAAVSNNAARFVLASLDTERDTPARLKEYARRQHLPEAHWSLLHGDAETVRNLAAALAINYKRDAEGDYGHSIAILLLDRKGEVVERVEGLGADASNIVERIRGR